MKRTLILTFFLSTAIFFKSSDAQVNINVNIGSQPQWGPVGYSQVDYYYLPDIESYYYVPTRQFVYLQGGRWIFASNLPTRYRNYNLYSGYKVVLNGQRPYHRFHSHKVKYKKYRGYHHKQNAIKHHSGKGKHIAYHSPSRNSRSGSYNVNGDNRPSKSYQVSKNNRSSYNSVRNSSGRNHVKYHKASSHAKSNRHGNKR